MGEILRRPSGRLENEGNNRVRVGVVLGLLTITALLIASPTSSLATLRTRDAGSATKRSDGRAPVATKSLAKKSAADAAKVTSKKKPAAPAAKAAKGSVRSSTGSTKELSGKSASKSRGASAKRASKGKSSSSTDCKLAKGARKSGRAKTCKRAQANREMAERSDAKIEAVRAYMLPDVPDYDLTDEKRYQLLNLAVSLLGRPYRFGASGRAFDCSGFVRTVFGEFGVELPHSARGQFNLGDVIDREELAPGDLVFFRTYRRDASHVGIYMGEDKFIHAASGIGVKISSLHDDYYAARYLGARRVDI